MEATLFSGWIYDTLKPYGEQLELAHPAKMKAISSGKKKSDTIDARAPAPNRSKMSRREAIKFARCTQNVFDWHVEQPYSKHIICYSYRTHRTGCHPNKKAKLYADALESKDSLGK